MVIKIPVLSCATDSHQSPRGGIQASGFNLPR